MMPAEIQEIRVSALDGNGDVAAVRAAFDEAGIDPGKISAHLVYRFQDISLPEAESLASKLLTDPVTQRAEVGRQDATGGAVFEIGYKRGVMNPVADTLLGAAHEMGIHPAAATSSVEFTFDKAVPQEELERVGQKLISSVQTIVWESPDSLTFESSPGPVEIVAIRELNDEALDVLSEKRRLFLNIAEMQVIQAYFRSVGRDPKDLELETLAQTWSEHCVHKTFKARLIGPGGEVKTPLITRIKETARQYFQKVGVVTAFGDNAGGFRFYEGQAIIAKGETHNSPVAVEPFGGSQTKNGGVYRDIVGCGLGGENFVAFMVNCLGLPDTKPEDVPQGSLHPKYLLKENFHGERTYGNPMGIPTHATALHFHPDFGPKPTSMGIVVGIIPEELAQKGSPLPGDILVSIGGKTGRDGIHGATFSSGAMTNATSTVDSTAVQIGNPIEEKRTFDAIIACRDAGLIRAVTDCGAGGYSSAVGEIGEGVGVSVQLNNVPLKYAGLAPWEIFLSEAQERMVLAVDYRHLEEMKKICEAYEAPMTVMGQFTGDNMLTVSYGTEEAGQLPMEFLHHGLPQREMHMTNEPIVENNDVPDIPTDWNDVYKRVLGHLNVASTETMLRQFDTTVQGRTVLHPFGGVYDDSPNDASVIAPMYGKPYGVVTALALNPILNRLDPYRGTEWAVATAAAKLTAVGGNIDESAMIDNFVWPKPSDQFLGDLDQSVDALCGMMNTLQIPCVSGKDSLSSTYRNGNVEINIPPVLNITIFGKIPDVAKTVSADIKSTGSTLVLVGQADVSNLGGSIYYQSQNIANTHQTQVDTHGLLDVLHSVHDSIATGRVKSCKAVAEGGLATTIAQMCFGGDCGAHIDVSLLGAKRPDFALFQETAGTFVVEVASEEEAHILFAGVPHAVIGRTTEEKTIQVIDAEEHVFSADLLELKQAWQEPLKEALS